MRKLALRHRLLLLTLTAIVPLALMAGVGVVGLLQQQRGQAEHTALEISRALASAVQAELERTLSMLQTLATSNELDDGDLDAFRLRANRLVAEQQDWITLIVADPQRRVLINTNSGLHSKMPQVAETESFDLSVRRAVPVVGFLARGPTNIWGVPLRAPVQREGAVRYVLTAVLKPQAIVDLVVRQRIPPDWIISVFDGKGRRVARSRSHEFYLGGAAAPSLQQLMASGAPEGLGRTEVLDGGVVYSAYTRLPVTGWTVAVGIPVASIERAGDHSLAAYGGGILVSLLLAVLGAYLVARSINRPIAALRSAAQSLGQGKPFSVPDSSIPEVREVAEALIGAMQQHARNEADRQRLLADAQEARTQAERANLVKDRFLAMLGHELRNPLAPITTALEIMNTRHGEHDLRERRIIERQVAHLTRLVDDLLDVARISGGKLELRRARIDLCAVATRAVELVAPQLLHRASRLEIALPAAPVFVYGDPVRLVQVLTNLLSNADKFTRSDDRIRLRLEQRGDMAEAVVEDQGCGIAAPLLGQVFDLFIQGEQSIDRRSGGLGLGLAIAKTIVTLHGGTVSAASDGAGRGATFTVRLPLCSEEPANAVQRAPASAASQASAKRVLVVDDNVDAADMLACLLQAAAGFTVRTAHDAAGALALLESFVPDVAVLDIGLPDIDGYELAQRLRADPRCVHTRIIALTGYGTEQDRAQALSRGFDAHCIKPAELDVLLTAMGER